MTFPILGGNSAVGGYAIDNSLRFNDNDSAYLSLATGTATSQTTFTFSSWIKTAVAPSSGQYVFFSSGNLVGAGGTDCYLINLNSSNFQVVTDGAVDVNIITNRVFRDVSSWYHFVVSVDTTQATASDRVKIYVNGELETSFGTASYPSLNYTFDVSSQTALVGCNSLAGTPINFFDGYMAETYLIDGQALSPTSFGEFDSDSGIWKPKAYEGTYTGNSFYLDFENSGSLGADVSGLGNNFTPTNLASTDQMLDTPTNNFCTLNSLFNTSSLILKEGNLHTESSSGAGGSTSTYNISNGKWYFETCYISGVASYPEIGIMNGNASFSDIAYTTNKESILYRPDGKIYKNNGSGFILDQTVSTASAGDIIGIAINLNDQEISFYVNNTQVGSTVDISYMSNDIIIRLGFGYHVAKLIANFGQDSSFAGNKTRQNNSDQNGYGDFFYAPPTGFLSLNSANLATVLSPTIDDGSQYFNTVIYSGNSTDNHAITGVGFQPDFTWIKNRNSTWNHALWNSVVGAGGGKAMSSDNTNSEAGTDTEIYGYLGSFDSDGFTLNAGTPTSANDDQWVNGSGLTYVAWNWKSGGTGVTNTNGSITSTVSANPTSGFSIVTYNLNTSGAQTVGHGLSKAPELILNKGRDSASTWWAFTTVIDGSLDYIEFSGTSAKADDSIMALPTSTTFGQVENYTLQQNVVSYCFHSVEGYSKIGKYTGNGSTDGPMITTMFRPAFVITRGYSAVSNWVMFDNARNTSNDGDTKLVYANGSFAESAFATTAIDLLSNGFKLRETNYSNISGVNYIYMAFAENPFVSSSGVPVTAR